MAVRVILLMMIIIYTVLSYSLLTGASVRVLLLLALFTGTLTLKELAGHRGQVLFLAEAAVLFCMIFRLCGGGFYRAGT